MIIPLPLVVSLLLGISYAATEFEYKIEYERCSQDTVCFVRKSCIIPTGTPPPPNPVPPGTPPPPEDKNVLEEFKGAKTELESEKCDVIVQIKPFSNAKYLVLMQFEPGTTGFKKDKGMAIMQNGIEQLACKKGAEPSVLADAFKLDKGELNAVKFDDDSVARCSFFVTSEDGVSSIAHYYEKTTTYSPKKPSFTYYETSDTAVNIVYKQSGSFFWDKPKGKVTCSLKNVKSSSSFGEEYELEKVDLSKPFPIKCTGSKMLVTRSDKKAVVDALDCTQDFSQDWSWGATPVISDTDADVEVACMVKQFCSLCADPTPAPACTDCQNPPPVTDPEGCKTITCPLENDEQMEWTQDGQTSSLIEGPMVCKKSGGTDAASATFGWFGKKTSGADPEEWPQFSCTKKLYTCVPPSESELGTCPKESMICYNAPKFENKSMICQEGGNIYTNGAATDSPSVHCDKGAFPPMLYCAEPLPPQPEAQKGGAGTGAIIGAVIGVIVAVVVAGGAAYYFLVIKKKQNNTKQAASSSKGPKSNKAQSKESKSKTSTSEPNKDSEKPKDAAAAAADPKKPDASPTPTPGPATPAAGPPKSDPADGATQAGPTGTSAV